MTGRLSIGGATALGLAAAALVVATAAGLRGGEPAPSPSATGRGAPTFALPRLADPQTTFDSVSLRGRAAVLNVWASWCVACREEHPLLMTLAKEHGVPLYGLNYRDDRADALRWLEFYGDPYRISGHDATGRVGEALGVRGIPATVVLDRDGVVRYRHAGPLGEEDWRRHVAPLLGEIGPRRPARGAS